MIKKRRSKLASDLWNINRSPTGEGVRQTFKINKKNNSSNKNKKINSNTRVLTGEFQKNGRWKKSIYFNTRWKKNM